MRDYARIEDHLLWDLEPWLSDRSGYLSDMPVRSAMAKALADSFYKKLCPLGNSEIADRNALIKFKAINDRIPSCPYDFAADSEHESLFWDYFRDNLNRAIGFDVGDVNYDLSFIREHMDVGPGAAQKANAESMVSKLFEGPISYCNSEHLIPLYRSALAETGLWAEAEKLRSSRFPFQKVKGGKIFFAPKNAEISRTCCTEANLNMLIQKSIGAFLEYRLAKHFGINLSVQPAFNQELARKGSIDGSFGTIDLASASDSISWQLMLRSLEDGFLKATLRMSRSESAVLPDGSEVVLNMISTMGNGFTFPLQTVIFASAVRACYQLMGLSCRSPQHEFAVFGDDIIVRREAYVFVTKMLTKLGFEVNEGKSFNSGPFRESCGHDYFLGVNIRGVYVKSLETPQQICSCINRLVRWTAVSGIPLVRTVGYLRSLLSKEFRVPRSESDDAGVKVPFTMTSPKVDANYWFKYRKFVKRSRKRDMPEIDDTPNPQGSAVGVLSGHIRRPDRAFNLTDKTRRLPGPISLLASYPSMVISIRDKPGERARYQVASSSIPFWDWPGYASNTTDLSPWDWKERDPREGVSHDSWKTAVMATFC